MPTNQLVFHAPYSKVSPAQYTQEFHKAYKSWLWRSSRTRNRWVWGSRQKRPASFRASSLGRLCPGRACIRTSRTRRQYRNYIGDILSYSLDNIGEIIIRVILFTLRQRVWVFQRFLSRQRTLLLAQTP